MLSGGRGRWRNRSSSDSSSCSKTSGWGRGTCVTMWRERAARKGRRPPLRSHLGFPRKAAPRLSSPERLFLERKHETKLTVFLLFSSGASIFILFFALYTIFLRGSRRGCFSLLLPRQRAGGGGGGRGGAGEIRPTGRCLRLGAPPGALGPDSQD